MRIITGIFLKPMTSTAMIVRNGSEFRRMSGITLSFSISGRVKSRSKLQSNLLKAIPT